MILVSKSIFEMMMTDEFGDDYDDDDLKTLILSLPYLSNSATRCSTLLIKMYFC